MIYKKWDVVLVDLNPTKGSEINKIRPCLIVSPNSVNTYMNTIVVVPFTSKQKGYPFRIATNHKNTIGELCFDHIKSLDKSTILKIDGTIDKNIRSEINNLLFEFFSE
ncbi:MAG: type II toxin-antitoxin system PemK/MazF family toxin [Flavobacterium sp.]|nr:type II toxin-antitoxin system PemK/MazF family toxin [Flavobacterium sp.]